MKDDIKNSFYSGTTRLPWHIYFDDKDDKKGERLGKMVHINEPRYECEFYIGKFPIETSGFSYLNTEYNVQVYNVSFPDDTELLTNISIQLSLKEASYFVYNILYMPFFRKRK